MRPVFFRMLPTFDSFLFGSTFAWVGGGAGLAATFFAGTAAAGSGLGGSGFGSSAAGCASGDGFTSGAAFDVVAALGSGGV